MAPPSPSSVFERHASRIHGTGEMARLIRAKDWGLTPLGPLASWSETLIATINLALCSSDTFAIYWGSEHILLYNDPYCALLHEKHPQALGKRGSEVWSEAWEVIGPQIEAALTDGKTTKVSEVLIPILASGQLKDGWYSYTFHPIYQDGRIIGVANPGRDDTEAVGARFALRKSEAELAQVLSSTADLIVAVNRDWKFTYLNPAAVQTYGAGRNLIGRSLWEEFPQAYYEGSPYVEHYSRAMNEGIAGSFEAEYEALNLVIRLEVYPTPDGFVTYSRDISKTRQAEQRLAEREQQLALAVERSAFAAWFYDPDRSVVGGDEKMRRLFGLAEREGPVEAWLAAVHPDDRDRVRTEFAAAVAGAPYDTEYRVCQEDGRCRWLRAKAALVLIKEKSRMVGICEDFSERRHFEEELRNTATRLGMAQETGKIASWRWDLATGAFISDGGSEWTYGRPASEMLSVDAIFPFLHDDDRERVRQDLRPAIEGTGDYHSEFRVLWPDGSHHWLQAFGKSILSADGKPVGIIGINMDVTDRKLAEAALLQTEKLAAVGRLASSIAHEINNPLESVTNLLYLARNAPEPKALDEYLEGAERELRRVSVITNQTLRFYKQTTKAAPVSCLDLFQETLLLYQGRLINCGIEVGKRKRATKPVVCLAGEIRQVLSNLIGNAIDAMPGGGRLTLRSREATNWKTGIKGIALTVADTGTGMPARVSRRIFEAFFSTKGIGGTGLGLWVSKELVERHRGTLSVRSSMNSKFHGTVFVLFLPLEMTSE